MSLVPGKRQKTISRRFGHQLERKESCYPVLARVRGRRNSHPRLLGGGREWSHHFGKQFSTFLKSSTDTDADTSPWVFT